MTRLVEVWILRAVIGQDKWLTNLKYGHVNVLNQSKSYIIQFILGGIQLKHFFLKTYWVEVAGLLAHTNLGVLKGW